MVKREQIFSLNGHTTGDESVKNKAACAGALGGVPGDYHWSSSELNSNNAVNVNFSNGNLNNNNNNNNKSNSFRVRAVSEFDGVFYKNVDLVSIYEAYYDCRKHKTSTAEYLMFHMDMDKLLYELWDSIVRKKYKPLPSTCFVVLKPVPREVFAANFRDRVVHHWICMRINPMFEALFKQLGDVSHNCRAGYGTSSAIKSLEDHIRLCSDNFTKDCWVSRFDFKGFFMSINKEILWDMLFKFVEYTYPDENGDMGCLLYLLQLVLENEPQNNCRRNSPQKFWELISPNKSLFTNAPNLGLPIGNLTSQLFANFFLSYFDWYMVKILGFEHYVRYVDDFAIVCDNKQRLLEAIPRFRQFLWDELKITLHPDKMYIQHVSKGIKFVGTQLKFNRQYVSNRSVANFYKTIMKFNQYAKHHQCLSHIEEFRSSINSYLGLLNRGNNYATKRKILNKLNKQWYKYIYFTDDFSKAVIKVKYINKTNI